MKLTTLCLINFNGLAHLQSLWPVLEPILPEFAEILLIDNGSTDGSVEYGHQLPGVTVVPLAQNLGPAAARNLGFKLARCERILFMDNDVLPVSGMADHLNGVLDGEGSSALLCAPRVCYRHQPDTIQYDSADCHVLGMMALRHADQPSANHPPELAATTSLVTACFLMDRECWVEHAPSGELPFDESLLFNYEDHDFGVRSNLLGMNLYCDSAVQVMHGSGTPGLSWRPGYAIAERRVFCLTRNRWWIVFRYFEGGSLIRLLPLLIGLELLQLAGLASKGHLGTWLKALVSTLQQFPHLFRQRQKYQAARRKRDRDILKPGPLPLSSAMTSSAFVKRSLALFENLIRSWCRWIDWPAEVKGRRAGNE